MCPGPPGADNLSVFPLLVVALIVFVCSLRIYRGLGQLTHAIAQAIAPTPKGGVTSPIRGHQAA